MKDNPKQTPERQELTAATVAEPAAWVPEEQWRKVHWITPLETAWRFIFALVVIFLLQFRGLLGDLMHQVGSYNAGLIIWAIVAVVLVCLLGVGFLVLSWRRTRYAVTTDAVHYQRGVWFRQEKQIKLSRLQAVDISRPLLGRIFGFGAVNVETAGGANSHVDLKYLSESELEPLRAEIIAHAAGLNNRSQEDATSATSPRSAAGATKGLHAEVPLKAPEVPIYFLETPALIRGALSTFPVVLSLLVLVVALGVTAVGIMRNGFGIGILAALTGYIVVIVVPALTVIWHRIGLQFGHTAAMSPDGVRLSSGLTATRHITIPPGRIHSLTLKQPFFWRRWGRWDLEMQVAGYSMETENGGMGTGTIAFAPVASTEEALRCAWLVVRNLGVSDPAEVWRAAMYSRRGQDEYFIPSAPNTRWLDFFSFPRKAYFLTDTALIIREGWITRRVQVILLEHIQSVGATQGPLQRLLDVASVYLHMAPLAANAKVKHQKSGQVAQLREVLSKRSQERRQVQPPSKWMQAAQQIRVSKVSNPTAETL